MAACGMLTLDMRRTITCGALWLALAMGVAAKEPVEGNFFHSVYFWLNEPSSAAKREEFLTALKKMKAIPGIRHAFIGEPAGTARDVVDNSYTFYWLVTFDDKKGWQVYNDHPLHDEFRKKASLWKKVLVYDSVRVK
jgi:hypothetical protein